MMAEDGAKAKPIKFLCYRYSVIPNAQMSLWSDASFEKRRVMEDIIRHCAEVQPISSMYYKSESVLFYMRPVGETAHLFKFCRKARVKRFEINPMRNDVFQHDIDSYPYVYVIVDTSVQVVMIQRKSSVFSSVGGAKGSFEALVKTFISDDNYYFSLDAISASTSFWETLKEADRVYEVTLKLKSPNFLGSRYGATQFLKELKRVSNNESATIILTNTAGELDIQRPEYDDAIDYIGAGGGSWSAKTSRGGSRRITHRSDDFVKTTELMVSDEAPLDDGEIIDALRDAGARKGDTKNLSHQLVETKQPDSIFINSDSIAKLEPGKYVPNDADA